MISELEYELIKNALKYDNNDKLKETTRGTYEVKPIVRPIASNQKSAKELFEELGYVENRKDNYAIVFSKQIDYLEAKVIRFYILSKDVEVLDIDVEEDEEEIMSFDMKELKAINQMCKELGWLDD